MTLVFAGARTLVAAHRDALHVVDLVTRGAATCSHAPTWRGSPRSATERVGDAAHARGDGCGKRPRRRSNGTLCAVSARRRCGRCRARSTCGGPRAASMPYGCRASTSRCPLGRTACWSRRAHTSSSAMRRGGRRRWGMTVWIRRGCRRVRRPRCGSVSGPDTLAADARTGVVHQRITRQCAALVRFVPARGVALVVVGDDSCSSTCIRSRARRPPRRRCDRGPRD